MAGPRVLTPDFDVFRVHGAARRAAPALVAVGKDRCVGTGRIEERDPGLDRRRVNDVVGVEKDCVATCCFGETSVTRNAGTAVRSMKLRHHLPMVFGKVLHDRGGSVIGVVVDKHHLDIY